MEIVGLASGPLVVALNLIQLALMAGIVVIAIFYAYRGRNLLGYALALGILFLGIHNMLEVLTEVEVLPVSVAKTLATLFLFVVVLLFATQEKHRLKLLGYANILEKEVEKRTRCLKRAEQEFRRSYDVQKVLNALLSLSLEEMPLKELLEHSLNSCSPYPGSPLRREVRFSS